MCIRDSIPAVYSERIKLAKHAGMKVMEMYEKNIRPRDIMTKDCLLYTSVLYHHMPWNRLRKQKDVPERVREAAQILNLADRADIYLSLIHI